MVAAGVESVKRAATRLSLTLVDPPLYNDSEGISTLDVRVLMIRAKPYGRANCPPGDDSRPDYPGIHRHRRTGELKSAGRQIQPGHQLGDCAQRDDDPDRKGLPAPATYLR